MTTIERETNAHVARPATGGIGRGVRSRGVLGGGAICASFAAAVLAGADPVHGQTPTIRYRVIHLGTIGGADDSAAYGINLFGHVTGVAGNAPFATPADDGWLWIPQGSFTPNARTYDPGFVTPLADVGSLASTSSWGHDLSDDGVVTGGFEEGASAARLGFVWQSSLVMTGLPTGAFHSIGSLQSAPATVASEGRAIQGASAIFSNVAGFSAFGSSPDVCDVAGLAWERNVAAGTESRTALMPACSDRSDARALGRNPSRVASDDLIVGLRRECGIGCASSLPCNLAVAGNPVVWVNGSTTPQTLSLPTSLDTLGEARDASGSGQLVGIGRQDASKACLGHAVWWQNRSAVATDLHVAGMPPLPTGPNAQSEVNAVNLLGQVVGADLASLTAQIWENPNHWSRTELDTVIADGDSVFVTPCNWEWQLQVARDINNERGWIVGEGLWAETGDEPFPPLRAFLLIPVDACSADADLDGDVDFDDLVIVQAGMGMVDCCAQRRDGFLCPADVTGDNVADFDDLLFLLTYWGGCDGGAAGEAAAAIAPEMLTLWSMIGGREGVESGSIALSALADCMMQPCQLTRFEALCGLLEH